MWFHITEKKSSRIFSSAQKGTHIFLCIPEVQYRLLMVLHFTCSRGGLERNQEHNLWLCLGCQLNTASNEASNSPLLIAFPPLCPAFPQQDGEENCKNRGTERIVVQDKDFLINKGKWQNTSDTKALLTPSTNRPMSSQPQRNGSFKKISPHFSALKMKNRDQLPLTSSATFLVFWGF